MVHFIVGPFVLATILSLQAEALNLGIGDACTNPHGKAGSCIRFHACDHLVTLLRKPSGTAEDTAFLQNSRCGSTSDGKPLVCCAGVSGAPRPSGSLPKPPQCGLDLSDRIVGGQPTELDEFPWTALIKYLKPNGREGFHCGGSLINSRYVLTAAHCINAIPRGWSVLGVRLGEYDLANSAQDCLDGVCADPPLDCNAEKIIVHSDYVASNKAQYDDIALIRLDRDVAYTAYIKPICLPVENAERNRNNVGTKATAAGWGRTETASASNLKLKVNLDIMDPGRCSNIYRSSGIILRGTQMCAGGIRGEDTCSGDSGGPLMKRLKSNYYLFGIVSFGPNKCGTKDVPGVYTNVASYIDWIESNLE